MTAGASLQAHPFRIYSGPADDPLNNFYIPALGSSVQYDRSAGFYSSSALAVAAAGVARLIQNGGRMRLLVGAALDDSDVAAIQKGHDLQTRLTERLLEHFPDPQDALMRQRLEVLAWMVAEGTLELKVVLPTDSFGKPIPAQFAQDYYHPKTGIFTDAHGNSVAFAGSVNESETAWRKNYETFAVYFSWNETQSYLAQVVTNFERLWQGQEKDWIALEIPVAVRERLLKFRPSTPPTHDPLEPKQHVKPIAESLKSLGTEIPSSERIRFQFVRDAPFLPSATELGMATSAILPWPHQSRVANEVIRRFPDRALLADEVGLGKTIEAGLVIRQLLLSGRVKRCLILAPKSVLKQWQEELYEKFALQIPRYDAGKFWGVDGKVLLAPNDNPWDAFDVLLAGSQLAKRAERREQILASKGWDLVVVDEAHHARRKDFKERIYRPNRLLGLLNDLNAHNKTAGLLLMTATPMQVHPLEVWDLLTVLGLGGRWRADEDNFLNFFVELRKPFAKTDWELVFDLVHDYLAAGNPIDPNFRSQAIRDLGPVKWSILEELPDHPGERMQRLKQLGKAAEPYVKEFVRRHTPLNHYIFRNTRDLLREYQKRGILLARVPVRQPHIERIPLRPEEQRLYNRIDEYTSHFYQKYENERRGMGFIMTIYRRRLTSSFYAVRKSLERRLAFLRGLLGADKLYDDDDVEQDDLDQDVAEEVLSAADRERFKSELDYLEDFIQQLALLSVTDSKLQALKTELSQVFKQRDRVLIFTQYTDTMDFIRDQLVEVYGSQVACYSGRGGEVWNGIAWVATTKEDVKNKFRAGVIRILLGTESASEGLNLQTCGVLINYDMPWNPMRVEQRIGRIDRIGQEHQQVWISNYFYKDTIEDNIYQRLADRINWFEVVVGDLQPILAQVGEITRRLAMLPPEERAAQLDAEIRDLRKRLQNREAESLALDHFLNADELETGLAAPISLADLENLLTTSSATKHLFQPALEMRDAYLLNWQGAQVPVTFSRSCFDEHPDTVQYLTYGNPLFAQIVELCPPPEKSEASRIVRCEVAGSPAVREWFAGNSDGAGALRLERYVDLLQSLASEASGTDASVVRLEEVRALFAADAKRVASEQQEIIEHRHLSQYLAERAKGQRLLVKAALVEIALGQQPEMFGGEVYPAAFTTEAIVGLQRHGFPWGALLQSAYDPTLAPSSADPYYEEIRNASRDSLLGRLNRLKEDAKGILQGIKSAHEMMAHGKEQSEIQIQIEPVVVRGPTR